MNIKNFKEWELNENSQESLNEFLGLGNLLKSFFKSLSEPVRKKVEIITKNIDDKTGKVSNSKDLMNELLGTFKSISDDKKADLKGVDDIEIFKDIMKEFMTEIKAVFSAARIPFSAIAESEIEDFDEFVDILTEEEINEKKSLKQRKAEKAAQKAKGGQKPAEASKPVDKNITLAEVMTKTAPEEFESQLSSFLDVWIEKIGGDKDIKKLETEGTKLIDTMMKKFETKIKEFGPERIQKLIKLSTKNPEPKKEDIKKALEEKPSDEIEGTPVETDAGKSQIMKAVEKALKDGNEMLKIQDGDLWNIVIKGVEF